MKLTPPVTTKKLDELVEKAKVYFQTKGYYRTSMAKIAAACGIKKSSVYHHVRSKGDLAFAVLNDLHEHFKAEIFDMVANENLSPAKKLQQVAHRLENFLLEQGGGSLMAVLINEVSDLLPSIRQPLQTFFNEYISTLTSLLSSQYTEAEAIILVEDVLSQIEGALVLSRVRMDENIIKRACDRLGHLIPDAS
ncbi:MAG: TetR/AcrR family transcriptional regulator [Gammaproteobacteria bacterium]